MPCSTPIPSTQSPGTKHAGGDPVTTGSSLCADAIDQHLSTRAGTAYGSLRPKERHRCCRCTAPLSQHGPRRCMVAGAFLGPCAAIDAGRGEAPRDCRAEEKMI